MENVGNVLTVTSEVKKVIVYLQNNHNWCILGIFSIGLPSPYDKNYTPSWKHKRSAFVCEKSGEINFKPKIVLNWTNLTQKAVEGKLEYIFKHQCFSVQTFNWKYWDMNWELSIPFWDKNLWKFPMEFSKLLTTVNSNLITSLLDFSGGPQMTHSYQDTLFLRHKYQCHHCAISMPKIMFTCIWLRSS